MTVTSGFHNSKNGDRVYNASQMNEPYKHIISNGVVPNPSHSLLVTSAYDMSVVVNGGFALVGDGWIRVDGYEVIPIDPAEATLKRIDTICLRWDDTDSVRNGTIVYKKGTPATYPVAPSLEKNDLVEELCLARINVNPGTTVIDDDMIEDTRGDVNYCGYVTQLIKGNSGVQGLTLSLASGNWTYSGGYYTQSVTVNGITSTSILIVSGDDGVICTGQDENKLTFRSPKSDSVTVKIINMGIL